MKGEREWESLDAWLGHFLTYLYYYVFGANDENGNSTRKNGTVQATANRNLVLAMFY
jgi:hypothetical protein